MHQTIQILICKNKLTFSLLENGEVTQKGERPHDGSLIGTQYAFDLLRAEFPLAHYDVYFFVI